MLSVITVCKNAGNALESTISSVESQKDAHIEYILVDAASTDDTASVAARHTKTISHFISEPDRGIYDAMNKGLSYATGELILFLNAKDAFYGPDVARDVLSVYEGSGADILYGDVVLAGVTTELRSYRNWELPSFFDNTMCHQGVFASRRTFDICGDFDITYKIAGDYEWLLRAWRKHRLRCDYLGYPVAYFDYSGISSQTGAEVRSLLNNETSRAINQHFTPAEIFVYRLARFAGLRQVPSLWRGLLSAMRWQ